MALGQCPSSVASQLTFTCLKSTMETEQYVKSVQSYNKDTRIVSMTLFWGLY